MQILSESTNTGVKWKQDRWSDYISRLDTIDINAASEEADEDCVQIASLTSDKPIHLSKDEVMRRMVMLIIIIVHMLLVFSWQYVNFVANIWWSNQQIYQSIERTGRNSDCEIFWKAFNLVYFVYFVYFEYFVFFHFFSAGAISSTLQSWARNVIRHRD